MIKGLHKNNNFADNLKKQGKILGAIKYDTIRKRLNYIEMFFLIRMILMNICLGFHF